MSEAVAKGSLVLTLDAQQLNQGLKKTAANAKQAGKKMSENFKTASGDVLKEKTGGDMGIMGMGMKAGVIGAAVAGAAMLGQSLWKAFGPMKDLNKEIERGAEVAEKWRDKIAQNVAISKEWVGSLSDIAGTTAGMQQLQKHTGDVASQLAVLNAETKKLKGEGEELDSWGSWDSWSSWATGGLEARQEAVKAQIDATKGSAKELQKTLDELKLQEARLKNPLTNPAAVAGVRQFVQSMADARAEAEGMSKELLQIQALKRQFNLNDAQVSEMRSAWAATEAAKAAAEAKKELAQATEDAATMERELREEMGLAVRRSTEETKLDEMIQKGVDEDQIARLRTLIAMKKKASESYKPLNAIVRGTSAEISFQNKNRFDQDKEKELNRMRLALERESNGWLGRIYTAVTGLNTDRPEI